VEQLCRHQERGPQRGWGRHGCLQPPCPLPHARLPCQTAYAGFNAPGAKARAGTPHGLFQGARSSLGADKLCKQNQAPAGHGACLLPRTPLLGLGRDDACRRAGVNLASMATDTPGAGPWRGIPCPHWAAGCWGGQGSLSTGQNHPVPPSTESCQSLATQNHHEHVPLSPAASATGCARCLLPPATTQRPEPSADPCATALCPNCSSSLRAGSGATSSSLLSAEGRRPALGSRPASLRSALELLRAPRSCSVPEHGQSLQPRAGTPARAEHTQSPAAISEGSRGASARQSLPQAWSRASRAPHPSGCVFLGNATWEKAEGARAVLVRREQCEPQLQLTHRGPGRAPRELAGSGERLCQQILSALLETLPRHARGQHAVAVARPSPWGRAARPSSLPARGAGRREARTSPQRPQTCLVLAAGQLARTLWPANTQARAWQQSQKIQIATGSDSAPAWSAEDADRPLGPHRHQAAVPASARWEPSCAHPGGITPKAFMIYQIPAAPRGPAGTEQES